MCGRYTASDEVSEYGNQIPFKPLQLALTRRFNISPTQMAAVMVQEDDGNAVRLMRWGLIPSWAKDASVGYKMINARAETVAEKPSYRTPFKKRRCLVLADGFYEWKKEAKAKQPFRFVLTNGQPLAFAGLWESWRQPDAENPVHTFTIITTEPNELTREVHDRMPVILPARHYAQWLDREFDDPASLQRLLSPYPAAEMNAYPVSTLVNSPKNEIPACIEPVPGPEP